MLIIGAAIALANRIGGGGIGRAAPVENTQRGLGT
jgi:hypothetical protein